MIALPAYIDQDAWQGFCDMRKLTKKPLTIRAAKMILAKLQKLKDSGQDPNDVLDQSTNHCWADVYPVKEDKTEPSGRLPEYRPEQRETTAMPADLKAKHGLLRRVG